MEQGDRQMRQAIIAAALAVLLAGCNQTVQIAKPCGVITDSLIGVTATDRDGNRRLAVHHERGVAAGCWGRK